jgi:anaphase-promoting complex subunit 4
VTTGLENLRRLVHENMLPALDRCSVILSRFAGIAKFQGMNDSVGFTIKQITLIMDTVACLHLVSSKILIQAVDELDLFTAFSSWLRYEIDRLASDSSTSPDDDKVEKEASIDHSKVLLYLQTAMTTSPLAIYFDDSQPEDHDNGWKNAEEGLPMYDVLDKQLQKQERGVPFMKTLPRIELLYKFLAGQASTIFSQIAEAEKRNVLFGEVHEVGVTESAGLVDMRMSTMVGLWPSSSNLTNLYRTPLPVVLILPLCQKVF